jgi:hypothetical protein
MSVATKIDLGPIPAASKDAAQVVFQGNDADDPRLVSGEVLPATPTRPGIITTGGASDLEGSGAAPIVGSLRGLQIPKLTLPNEGDSLIVVGAPDGSEQSFRYGPAFGGVDARTGTAENIDKNSTNKLVTFNNAGAQAVTLKDAVGAAFFCMIESLGVGVVTLTPESGTIKNGSSSAGSLVVTKGFLWKLGADWRFVDTSGGGGGGTWGSITGTLSAQTDLQSALDAKLDDSQLDTDSTFAANSDSKIASQKAVKTALAAKMTNPMTTVGDLIVGGTSGAPSRVAAAAVGKVWASNGVGVAPSWQDVAGLGLTNQALFFGTSAPGISVSLRQSAIANNVSSLAYTSSVISGNLMVLVFSSESTLPTSISDSLASSWSKIDDQTGTRQITIWYATAPSSGANTVTLSGHTLSFSQLCVMEFVGLQKAFDVKAKQYSNTSPATLSLTTTVDSDVWLMAIAAFHSANTFTSSDMTLINQLNGSDATGVFYSILGLPGTYTKNIAIGGSSTDNSPNIAVALKPIVVSIGADGDYYVNLANAVLYKRTAGVWGTVSSIPIIVH